MWEDKDRDRLYPPELYPEVIAGLKAVYKNKLRAAEQLYKFDEFHSPLLKDSDFDAKPMVLLLGQYSTGKTTFIEYILERKFPGERVGPEPTTDRFVAVTYGEEDRIIPGNALSVDADKPFHALNKFGTGFLSKFEAAECKASILEHITFVDTPGVLSGEKQRIGRSYDFVEVVEWFAERADLILLLFDAHKLDISDEFKRTIEILKGHDDKIRVVLNKADMINSQQLMRVYGALMWSLGKVVKTPEVMRVYIGSFWNKPLQNEENKKLFEAEQADLLKDLRGLPRNSAVRKVNELVKRARLAKVHSLLISHFKKKMPTFFGKEAKKEEIIKNLLNEFREVKRQYRLAPGDFPELNKFAAQLKDHDFDSFPRLNMSMIQKIEEVLGQDIPRLMQKISPSQAAVIEEPLNPFDDAAEDEWSISDGEKVEYNQVFLSLNPVSGKLTGGACKQTMLESGLGGPVLKKIWDLADVDKDGKLDSAEFAIAMFLIRRAKEGGDLPDALPEQLLAEKKKQTA